MGKRQVPFSRELWIRRDDYTDAPAKGYFRLAPGATVRLRYGYVVKCVGFHNGTSGAPTSPKPARHSRRRRG
jgi:glutaminyl-tRNA synthetase